jgi:hypothetical protein
VSYANGRAIRRARLRKISDDTRRAFGCTCRNVDIAYHATGPVVVGADHLTVVHVDGCPAVRGRTFVLVPHDYGRCGR